MKNQDTYYHQSIDNCLKGTIGDGGLDENALAGLLAGLRLGLEGIAEAYEAGSLPMLQLPERRQDLKLLEPVAEHYRENFTDVLILGTGGSSLGSKALHDMARPKGGANRKGPNLHIVTNVDPFSFDALIHRLDCKNTGVVVISKSGSTTETMMQFIAILPHFREALGEAALAKHFTLITEPTDNPLRRLGARFGLPVLDHDPKVGGRYSVLSLVGMLPTMIAGLNPEGVREGAEAVLRRTLSAVNPEDSAPALGAAVNVGLNRHNDVSASVMLAYSDRLGSLARWYRQLWAESLGKEGHGTTPVYAMGPVDQHSQLQLWLDGPKDKIFTVLGGPVAKGSDPIDVDLASDPKLDFMVGRTMGDLMDASRRATAETLAKNGRPVRLITLDEISEVSMGALMMHFMLETILAANLLNVDPFDQPAVEQGKVLIRQYMREMG
ncbi:glucose-6-phosphate isomerase [Aestuariispira insulae]|uniref:Glucose-6-phosphate isomerase n=1 Tax=Aestuariispira insulae TaxID=1461337 RepID=A0A3D9HGD8_9PROT|nr:glucose-6-phosphate isomerase [Aestuariispira insulae]RED48524.1 glucose-6-phosphate isomerase [Aestuariispira insulae]